MLLYLSSYSSSTSLFAGLPQLSLPLLNLPVFACLPQPAFFLLTLSPNLYLSCPLPYASPLFHSPSLSPCLPSPGDLLLLYPPLSISSCLLIFPQLFSVSPKSLLTLSFSKSSTPFSILLYLYLCVFLPSSYLLLPSSLSLLLP